MKRIMDEVQTRFFDGGDRWAAVTSHVVADIVGSHIHMRLRHWLAIGPPSWWP